MLAQDVCHTNELPSSLQHLFQNLFQRNIQTPAELLIALVYYLFLESGFAPATLPIELKSKIPSHWGYSFIAQIPDFSWNIVADQISEQFGQWNDLAVNSNTVTKSDQIYEFKLNLLKHSSDEMQLVIRKIFTGNALLCTFCTDKNREQASSIILPVAESINITAISGADFDIIRQNPQHYFTNIRELSGKIKQDLIAPLHNSVMYDSAYPHAALNGLPKEILWILFNYIRSDLKTLQNISMTCVYLRNMAITFLNEMKIGLKQRRPTPIVHDTSEPINRRRFPMFNVHPWHFLRFNYLPQYPI